MYSVPTPTKDQMLISTVSDARFRVIVASRFVGYLLFSTNVYISEDIVGTYDTAAAFFVNGKPTVALSARFWNTLNEKHRAFLIYHEVSHIFLSHIPRWQEQKYDKDDWNKATDYYINLIASGYSYNPKTGKTTIDKKFTDNMEMPPCGLFNLRFIGKSADEIYRMLRTNGNNDDDGQPLENFSDSEMYGTPIDEVTKLNIAKSIKAAIITAEDGGIGTSENDMISELKESFEPIIDYRGLIDSFVRTATDQNLTYNRPSSRNENDVIFPRKEGDHLNIFIGSDSSGSMGDEDYEKVYRAIYDVVRQFDSWKIYLASCDTKAHLLRTLDSEEDYLTKESLTIKGLGGTDMLPMVKMCNNMIKSGHDIDVMIIITDGYIPENLDGHMPKSTQNIVFFTRNTRLIDVTGAAVIPL